jgi:hypothetical protein
MYFTTTGSDITIPREADHQPTAIAIELYYPILALNA